jgi:cell division protein FtsB
MQIKTDYKQPVTSFLNRFNDIRFVGQVIFVVIVLLISWSGVKSIQANYNLQKQIASIKEQNSLQTLQNENLKLQNDYYKTNQYLDLSARQNFGLADPNEKELIVPQQVALAHTVNIPSDNSASLVSSKSSASQSNLESWVNFFLHRHTND